ncbi:hypothetical protein DPMN_093985 [Dreissena polymorpha]|uniref:Uncharacterized protein n=1 Tax=Dreissena polymorpha TaxID=45954 RepID=A0A9D4R292_DREPO|nr:hypothetical protein DPMN_093985 [Dreissena polymorpha]
MASYWSKRRKIGSSLNLQVDAISNIYTETNQINNDAELVDSTVPSYSNESPDLQIPLFVDNEESDALDLASDSDNSASSVADHDTLNILYQDGVHDQSEYVTSDNSDSVSDEDGADLAELLIS